MKERERFGRGVNALDGAGVSEIEEGAEDRDEDLALSYHVVLASFLKTASPNAHALFAQSTANLTTSRKLPQVTADDFWWSTIPTKVFKLAKIKC